jgi:hypothetical protein
MNVETRVVAVSKEAFLLSIVGVLCM